jgi:hypothetical protein
MIKERMMIKNKMIMTVMKMEDAKHQQRTKGPPKSLEAI